MIYVDKPEQIPRMLYALREALGMSRTELATKLAERLHREMSSVRSQLWFWETGAGYPDMPQLIAWMAVLDVRLAIATSEDDE